MNKGLRLSLISLALVTVTQLLSCASPAARKFVIEVVTTIGTEVIVECTRNDCFSKPANAASEASNQSLSQTIQDYYALINQRKYESAWSYLSPNFKARQEDNGGYNSYVDWWNTIDAVTIKRIEVIEDVERQIHVRAELKYFKRNGEDASHVLQLSCIWDADLNRWSIDSAEVLSNS
jgi:hypothetical protein